MDLINTSISTEDYLGQPMWVVTLSDDTTVYQSDNNPNLDNPNSWLGLKDYVYKNGLYIKDMVLRFRDHVERIGSGEDGYFFVHMILGNFVGYNQTFYNIGVLKDGVINGNQWIIPELMVLEQFSRDPNDQYTKESVIRGKIGVNRRIFY